MNVSPTKVAFGAKTPGEQTVAKVEISACGNVPLELYDLRLQEGSSADFELDLAPLGMVPSIQEPLVLVGETTASIDVIYVPDAPNSVDENQNIKLDEGTIGIVSNAFEIESQVPLSGAGVETECPTAVIKCAEGNEVIPQTELHLDGNESYASNGSIQKWLWSVDQPTGSQSVFVPSNSFPTPTFEPNVAGVYTFYLTVYDQTNAPSCLPAAYEAVVISDEAIHIELLWHTPGDPDETDQGPEAGADLDLHFVHPYASGPDLDNDGAPDGWFDMPFDCFWFNSEPNWGTFNPDIDDDPGLDRDDTDGAGPESLNLAIPEEVTYRVGAHYYNPHGFGASYATVRVYIYSQLVYQAADVLLVEKDMWEVCTIEWPSGTVDQVGEGGQHKITPDYPAFER